MGAFTQIPEDTFNDLQLDAGVLLNAFDPASPAIADNAIITATTGGITVLCQPTFADFFEDVDNAPNNTKEGKQITGWDCRMSTTAIGTSPELIKMALGAADIFGATYALTSDVAIVAGKTYYTRSGTSPDYVYTPVENPVVANIGTYYEMTAQGPKVVPRRNLSLSDFESAIWWVGDKADGGMVAVKLLNALSTGGFNLKTTKNGKGQLTLEITGHVSINAQNVVPMEFYSTSGTNTGTGV